MRDWKYAVSFAEESPMTAPLPLAGDLYENMEKARKFGFDAVEFHTRENFRFDMDRIARMRKEGKGDICALVTGRLFTQGNCSMLGETEESVQGAMDGLTAYIHAAKLLQVNIIIGWVKGSVPAGRDRGIYLDKLGERLKCLNDYAKLQNVRIFVEVINHYETNIFNTAKETLDFFDKYDLDNCYVHLDTYHMGIEECDPYEAIRLCGKRLGYFHVADNSRRYPGSGQFDFRKILAALKEVGYSGYVTVECLPEPDRDTAAQKAIEHLKLCEP